ncbi:MAG: HK97 family phage prohead protease [Candidatus Dormibacteria bacterium]
MHTHPKPDGSTVTHGGHSAAPGHIHHADGPDGPAGAMLDVLDSNDEIDDDDVVVDPLQDVLSVPGVSGQASQAPRSNLIRARVGAGVEWRATDSPAGELFGHFSRFNTWYEIDSLWEGRFLERVLPGAFADTIANDRASMRVLYEHGMDPSLGSKPLGTITTLREDEDGAYYEAQLYDTDYNRGFLVPVLSGQTLNGQTSGSSGLGASFRFEVQADQWNRSPKLTKRNPGGLPERSITRAKVFEFGPVTFPASAAASASVRSLSAEFLDRLTHDPGFLADFRARTNGRVAARTLASRQEQLRRRARALLGTAV